MRPIDKSVGQGFGTKGQAYTNLGMAGHNGWDFPAPLGTPVRAPESGRAVSSWDGTGYGNLITIRGNSGWEHKLAHLQRFGKTGNVKEGDVVGYVNSTGLSTGNHLHWGTRPPKYNPNNEYYGYVNPQQFLNTNQVNPAEAKKLRADNKTLRRALNQANFLVATLSGRLYLQKLLPDSVRRKFINYIHPSKIVEAIKNMKK